MKIELKRFTTNARLSQETTAFAADIWVDGKKVGHASNDGHGGATIVHLDQAVRAAVEAHGMTLVPEEYKSFTSGAEWIVDQLVAAALQSKADAAIGKKIAKNDANAKLFSKQYGSLAARFRAGDSWCWFSYNRGDDPKTVAAKLATKHGSKAVDELVVLS